MSPAEGGTFGSNVFVAGVVGLIVDTEDAEDVEGDVLEVEGMDVVDEDAIDAAVVVGVDAPDVGLALEGEGRLVGLSGASLAIAKTTTPQNPLMVNLSRLLPSFWR